jgi:hypothetical protein
VVVGSDRRDKLCRANFGHHSAFPTQKLALFPPTHPTTPAQGREGSSAAFRCRDLARALPSIDPSAPRRKWGVSVGITHRSFAPSLHARGTRTRPHLPSRLLCQDRLCPDAGVWCAGRPAPSVHAQLTPHFSDFPTSPSDCSGALRQAREPRRRRRWRQAGRRARRRREADLGARPGGALLGLHAGARAADFPSAKHPVPFPSSRLQQGPPASPRAPSPHTLDPRR